MKNQIGSGISFPLPMEIGFWSFVKMIELSPPGNSSPPNSHIPYKHSVRWKSPMEDGEIDPLLAIFVTQKAFIRACAHAGSDLDNEVGGWLAGKRRFDCIYNKEFIVVEKVLPASYTKSGNAYLTFTQDSQVDMHAILEEYYPGKEIVGWYHTHPGMGIFLSQQDTWLHANFFRNSWQVALVIEPVSATGGFFIPEAEGQLDPRKYHGFFELLTEYEQSVVHWKNMTEFEPVTDGGLCS
jgi:proteasome lid subunit RPN8/RPN11